jgi:hypothetical protein
MDGPQRMNKPRPNRRRAIQLGMGATLAAQTPVAASTGCEMLLFVKDLGEAKAGDVCVVVPINHPWGDLELGGPHYTCAESGQLKHVSEHPNGNHAFWRVVRFTNINLSQASVFKAIGFEQERLHDDPLPPTYRAFYIDFAKLTDQHAALREHILDDSRKLPIHVCDMSYAELKKLISARREVFV